MAKICGKYITNKEGKEVLSELYLDLTESKINGKNLSKEDVDEIYNTINLPTSSFKDWFGDWKKDGFSDYKIDDNGEPIASLVTEWASKNMPRFSKNEVGKKIGEIILNIERQINILKQRQATAEDAGKPTAKKTPILKLEKLKEQLEQANELEAIQAYTENGLRMSYAAMDKLNSVANKLESGEKVAHEDIASIANANSFMQSYTSMLDIRRLIPDKQSKEYKSILELSDNIEAVTDKYLNVGIPVLADYLLEYLPENINAETQAVIDNISEKDRNITRWVKRSDEYKKLKKKRKNNEINSNQFKQEVRFLTINHVKNNKLINRESLINWLKVSHKDKSTFSVLFDPIIYSSDATLQLFAKSLKSQLFKAEMRSRDVLLKLNPAFNEFRDGHEATTSKKLNEALMETVSVSVKNKETGKYENKRIQSFTQEFLVDKFKEEQNQAFEDAFDSVKAAAGIDSDVHISNKREFLDQWFKRIESEESNKKYGEDIGNWFSENTVPVDNAKEQVEKVKKQLKFIDSQIFTIKVKDDISINDRMILEHLELEKEDLSKWMKSNYSSFRDKETFKGSLCKPSKKYSNPRYEKIQNTPRLKKYYDTLFNQFKEDQKKLPNGSMQTNQWEDFSYLAPSVRIADTDRLLEQNLKKNATELISDLKVQATDTQYGDVNNQGEEVKSIPVFYTNLVDEGDVTKDLVYAVAKFNQKAEEYKAKYEIQAEVNLMTDVLQNREAAVTNSQGQTMFDALAKGIGIEKFIKKKGESNAFEHYSKFIDMIFYGKSKVKQEVLGLDVNKITDKLIGLTAKNNLAFNLLSGVSNVTTGEVMIKQEAYAGKYFTRKELAKASLEYTKQFGAITDFNAGAASTILGQMIEIFDPIQGDFAKNFGDDISGSKLKKMLGSDALGIVQTIGEHEMQVRTMIAMMMHKEVTLKDGTKTNLYDAVKKNAPSNKDGKITAKSIVESLDGFSFKDLTDFRDRVHGVNGKLGGKFNEFDKATLKRRAEGRLLLLFKGHLVPGLRRRYGHGDGLHLDTEMGTVNEGYYSTFIDNFLEGIETYGKQFYKITNDLSPHEKANFKRAMTEVVSLVMLSALVTSLASIDGDDDDWAINFLSYQARRLQSEVLTFNPAIGISEMWKMIKSPTAVIGTVEKTLRLGHQLFDPFETLGKKTGYWDKGDYLLIKRLIELTPVLNGLTKASSPEDALKFFNLMTLK